MTYSPNGAQLLTTGLIDGKAKLWNARTGALLHSYVHYQDPGVEYQGGSGLSPLFSATSPDGSLGADFQRSTDSIKLRDNATGDVVATLLGHDGDVQSVAFDEDGKRLAAGNADGTVQVWDVTTRSLLRSFAAHKGLVDGVAFNPDGSLLATAGEDTTAKLWDPRTGKEILTVTGHTLALTAVVFSPDGKRLATGSNDGTVRIYVLPVHELMAVARSRLTRGWTKEECKQYLPRGRCPHRP